MIDLHALLAREWPDEHPPGLPWHEPGFSRRMLAEHLDQTHDMASRRSEIIGRHVDLLTRLIGDPTSVLDMGCGPGLYTKALADRGHTCVGIDIGPAAIAHADEHGVDGCSYILGDILTADPGSGHGVAMMLFGQIDTFAPRDADRILTLAHGALAENGLLIVEVHRRDHVESYGGSGPAWWASNGGLFADEPHLVLEEHRWVADRGFSDSRHLVITGRRQEEHLHRTYAATAEEWRDRLETAGFRDITDHGPFTDEEIDSAFRVISARRRDRLPRGAAP